jgi:hypothetical protein
VETVNPEILKELQANDILFIDSGHTVRIGGDVNFLILEVLPLLNPGVIVHFQDAMDRVLSAPGFSLLQPAI